MKPRFLILVPALALAPPASFANTLTAAINVSTQLVASCTTANPLALNFGNVSNSPNPIDVAATIQVTCSTGTNFWVYADHGQHSSGSNWRMLRSGGTDTLPYTIYSDTGRTTVFPTTQGAAAPQTATGTATTVTVYGRLPPPSPLPATGTYQDTLGITVSY